MTSEERDEHEPNIHDLEQAIDKSGKPLEMVVSAYLDRY